MKKIIIHAAVLLCLAGCKEELMPADVSIINDHTKPPVPAVLLNPGGESWKLSLVHAGSYNSSNKAVGDLTGINENKLINLKFMPDGNGIFLYRINATTTAQVAAQVSFRNSNGKNIFVVNPVSGIKTTAGKKTIISNAAVKEIYSITYWWEKVSFKNMPSEDFLLLVDINAHQLAAAAKTAKPERAWVSKFYSRK
jgi:hypothetical protein